MKTYRKIKGLKKIIEDTANNHSGLTPVFLMNERAEKEFTKALRGANYFKGKKK
jgi:hypothetical protein